MFIITSMTSCDIEFHGRINFTIINTFSYEMHCTARELLRVVVMLNDVCHVVHVAIAPLCPAFFVFPFSCRLY